MVFNKYIIKANVIKTVDEFLVTSFQPLFYNLSVLLFQLLDVFFFLA